VTKSREPPLDSLAREFVAVVAWSFAYGAVSIPVAIVVSIASLGPMGSKPVGDWFWYAFYGVATLDGGGLGNHSLVFDLLNAVCYGAGLRVIWLGLPRRRKAKRRDND